MKLIMVRHGETEDNRKNIIQSHGSRLTDKGIEQSRKLALRLKDRRIDAIFSSDLLRSKETVKEIIKFHKNVRVFYTSEIRERDLGIFKGRSINEYLDLIKKQNHSGFSYKPDGGESFSDVHKRASIFLEKVKKEYPDKTVLVVTHGGFIMMMFMIILKKTFEEVMDSIPENASINIFEISNGQTKVQRMTSIEHLG